MEKDFQSVNLSLIFTENNFEITTFLKVFSKEILDRVRIRLNNFFFYY